MNNENLAEQKGDFLYKYLIDFNFFSHVNFLHFDHESGIAFASKPSPGSWEQYSPKYYKLALSFLANLKKCNITDYYLAVNAFAVGKGRRYEFATFLTANFVDLDFYKLGLTFEQAQLRILSICANNNIPFPSLVFNSGRGAYCIWCFDNPVFVGVNKNPELSEAEKKSIADKMSKRKFSWRRTQEFLVQAFAELEADPKCVDVSRVLRLAGTFNSNSNTLVQAYSIGEKLESFSQLHDPLAAIYSKPKAHTVKPKLQTNPPPKSVKRTQTVSPLFTLHSLNYGKLADFYTLSKLRGGKHADYREMSIFHYAVAASFFYHSEADLLDAVSCFISECILQEGKYDASKPASCIKTVIKRFRRRIALIDAKASEEDIFKAQYTYRTSRIVADLCISEEEQRHMSVLIGKEEKYRRKNLARNEKRYKSGGVTRSEYLADAKSKADKAKELRAQGLTIRNIADEIGLSKSHVQRLIK